MHNSIVFKIVEHLDDQKDTEKMAFQNHLCLV